MRLFLIPFFVVSISFLGYTQTKYATESQKAIKYYEKAIEAFNQRDYIGVEENLNSAIKKDPQFIDAYLLRAELYRLNYQVQNQISDLTRAVEIDPLYFPYVHYNLGMAFWSTGNYNDAYKSFNDFLALEKGKETSREKAKEFLLKCEFAQSLVDNPVEFKPISMGDSINTENDEYWPSLSIDGSTFIYSVLLLDSTQKTITGHFAHQEDFFISEKVNGLWTKGKALGYPINTPGNEGALKISADGNIVVYTACNRSDGYGRCDIYFAYKTTTGWTRATNAGKTINSSHSEKQPCLSADANTLYFSSNRPGGFGEMDIWYSELDDQGYWGEPINMGSTINTPYDEESPFFHPDNQTFYFSSYGHRGLGMKDIFYSRINDSANWQTPVNIGYPINTYQDEIGLFIDNTGENAYYSTNYNTDSRNIYQFTLPIEARPHSVSYLKGIVTDIETNSPLEATLVLLNAITGKKIMEVKSKKENGEFLICLPSGNQYALNVSCSNYLFHSVHFNLKNVYSYNNPYEQNIQLQPIKINESVVLQNIFFEYDSFHLMPESTAELKKIEEYINNNPDWIFEIGGHTDQSGSADYNMELSEKRAKTVYEFLLSKNINPNSLTYKGYGELMPITKNGTPEDKAANRRTELKIVNRIK
jgi:outer membrane protein OmpA-like peptidoglycan-associated protein